ncbi:hypothetical protein BC831DRAFT_452401 [Entophlyctis helioformis]|nr:hypothetical protein BC831DRAFT_452401 [Entophlyctis helioformis]
MTSPTATLIVRSSGQICTPAHTLLGSSTTTTTTATATASHRSTQMAARKPDRHDVGPSALVICSSGASPNVLDFYSTTASTTHCNWLPLHRAKFRHSVSGGNAPRDPLDVPLAITVASGAAPASALPTYDRGAGTHDTSPSSRDRPVRKQQTGYSKNCQAFVEYDPKVDEIEYKFADEAYLTSHGLSYKPPTKPNFGAFAKTEFVAEPINESGFTRLPKFRVTDQGRRFDLGHSEMKDKFLPSAHVLREPSVDTSRLVPSSSAYTSDTGHIDAFGIETGSPFAKPPPAPLRPPPGEPISTYPARMDPDGFTRSESGRILDSKTNPPGLLPQRTLDHIRNSDPMRWMMMHDDAGKSTANYVHHELHPMEETMRLRTQRISIGQKEDAGSVRNNHPFLEIAERNPVSRFTTETQERFGAPKDTFSMSKVTACNGMKRSGFTGSNKFEYTLAYKDQSYHLGKMHPTVQAYTRRQENNVLAPKPTSSTIGVGIRT